MGFSKTKIIFNIYYNILKIKPKIFMLPFAFLRLYKH